MTTTTMVTMLMMIAVVIAVMVKSTAAMDDINCCGVYIDDCDCDAFDDDDECCFIPLYRIWT